MNVFHRGVTQPEPCISDDYHGSQSCKKKLGSRDNRDKEPTTAIHFTSDKRIRQDAIYKKWKSYRCKDIEVRESLLRVLLLFQCLPKRYTKEKGRAVFPLIEIRILEK